MKAILFKLKYTKVIVFNSIILVLILTTLYTCAGKKLVPNIAQLKFRLNNEVYRLHSIIFEEKSRSFNRLIADDFLAFDYDQDGTIDHIALGDADFNKVQMIYEHGIEQAARKNKLLKDYLSNVKYIYENHDHLYEIKSYRPSNANPFNEIKIIDKRQIVSAKRLIALDQEADGTLDQVLKGRVTLNEIQTDYSEIIKIGLQKGDLIRIENMILVKEK
jgi:hypothetical protein